MASVFSRGGRSSLSYLFHRPTERGQISAQPFSLLARCMSTGLPKLFVGGLSGETNESQLRDAFSSFGEVTETIIVLDKETRKSRGFGFVCFASASDADAAMKTMNGRNLNGKTLRVNFATDRPRGLGGSGGYGGGGAYGGGGGGGYGGGGGGYRGGYSDEGSSDGYGAGSY